jgi:hypothetical protein
VNEETSAFGMGQGCPVHGDEHMKECSMCGAEFCRVCFPKKAVCPECGEQSDDEVGDNPDFDDVGKLDTVLDEEDEDEKDAKDDEEEDVPPGDSIDDDVRPF